MREIKFRAYVVESLIDSQWIENGYGVTKIKYTDGTSSVHILTAYGDYQVAEESVGQYTGLKDKNKREIYEGDIVQFTDNYNTDIPPRIGVVKFNNASFYITDGAYSCYRWIDINVEIIGNIYENPELI